MFILDYFFLKYEEGRGGEWVEEKVTLKKPSLISVKTLQKLVFSY